MEELLNKLRSNILEEILKLKKELEKIEKTVKLQEENLDKFVSNYNKTGKLDIEILKEYYDLLEIKNLRPLDDYIEIQELLKYYESINIGDHSLFATDISKCRKIISNLITEVNRLRTHLFQEIRNSDFRKKELEKNNNYLVTIDKIIESFSKSKYMSEESIDFLHAYLSENKLLSDEELCLLFKNITMTNAMVLNGIIKLEILKQQEHEEKLRIEQELKEQELKEQRNSQEQESELIYLESESQKENCPEELLLTFLTEQQLNRYNETLSLVRDYGNVDEKIKIMINAINEKSSLKERVDIYESLSSVVEKLELAVYDLKINILPRVEEKFKTKSYDKKDFSLMKDINEYCNKLIEELNKENEKVNIEIKDYRKYLKDLSKEEELEICDEIDELIKDLLSFKDVYPNYYGSIIGIVNELSNKKKDYVDAIELIQSHNDSDCSELIEVYYADMKECLINSRKKFDDLTIQIENNPQQLLKLSEEFYNGATEIKNIIIFTNDDGSIISNVENDILNDRLTTSNYYKVLKTLQDNVSDDFVATSDHKVKYSTNYSEEFVKKYRLKNKHCGDMRIFYSRFNTNLGSLLKKDNIHVIFIPLVGYSKNPTKKTKMNFDALKRSYDDRKNIGYYIDLFNTDWSKLSEAEYNKKTKEVFEYLEKQNMKLGHLIQTYNKKQKLESGRRMGNE